MNPAQIQRGIIALKSNGPLKWNQFRSELGNPDRLTKAKVMALPEIFAFDKSRHHVHLVLQSANCELDGDDGGDYDDDNDEDEGEDEAFKEDKHSVSREDLRSMQKWIASDRGQHGYRKKLMKGKHAPAKAAILHWLWEVEHPKSFWSSLKRAAQSKEWKSFGQAVQKAWVAQGGAAQMCDCLQGSQHCMQIWRGIADGY